MPYLLISQGLALGLSIGIMVLLVAVFFLTWWLLARKEKGKSMSSMCAGCSHPCARKKEEKQ